MMSQRVAVYLAFLLVVVLTPQTIALPALVDDAVPVPSAPLPLQREAGVLRAALDLTATADRQAQPTQGPDPPSAPVPGDFNGDGFVDDVNGDGDVDRTDGDFDGDGDVDADDNDRNGDGVVDEDDGDVNGDGVVDDTDGDGDVDADDGDLDGDGDVDQDDLGQGGPDVPIAPGAPLPAAPRAPATPVPNGGVDGDINGDGIIDDVNGDGVVNEDDGDFDGDGDVDIDDNDRNGDGVVDEEDGDLNGDGLIDDVDGDGDVDEDDGDIDGDGDVDGADRGLPAVDGDVNGDGLVDDVDGDGDVDADDGDVDGDGDVDLADMAASAGDDPVVGDLNGDGIINEEDGDLNGDGIIDEADGDVNGDGIIGEADGDLNGDGIIDDFDGDGDVDADDGDTDGDGFVDADEAANRDGVPGAAAGNVDGSSRSRTGVVVGSIVAVLAFFALLAALVIGVARRNRGRGGKDIEGGDFTGASYSDVDGGYPHGMGERGSRGLKIAGADGTMQDGAGVGADALSAGDGAHQSGSSPLGTGDAGALGAGAAAAAAGGLLVAGARSKDGDEDKAGGPRVVDAASEERDSEPAPHDYVVGVGPTGTKEEFRNVTSHFDESKLRTVGDETGAYSRLGQAPEYVGSEKPAANMRLGGPRGAIFAAPTRNEGVERVREAPVYSELRDSVASPDAADAFESHGGSGRVSDATQSGGLSSVAEETAGYPNLVRDSAVDRE